MKPMREVALLLEEMLKAGVVTGYAVFGAVAQMRYTEAVLTDDADVIVSLPGSGGLDPLRPIYEYCRSKGFSPQGQYMQVGNWPVQFHLAYNALMEEALREALVEDFEGVPIRVVRADHLALLALQVGRGKDYTRILQLMESGSVDLRALEPLAERHGLGRALSQFRSRFGA